MMHDCGHIRRWPLAVPAFLALVLVLLALGPGRVAAKGDLAGEVMGLGLGMQGYIIGKKLSPEQGQIAKNHAEGDAHAGTMKFVDGDLHVVVDKKSGRVLALYKRREGAGRRELKTMVAGLMDRFGAPTLMAHDKIIYWAFNRHGAISEQDFARARKVNQVPQLGIIATVKLNSDLDITSAPPQKGKEGEGASADVDKGVIYFIITSDPLVRRFLDRQGG